jgi:hypothetical protein
VLHLISGDMAKMEESLARAVRLNPELDQAWEMRLGFLAEQKKIEQVLAVSREWVRHRGTARNRFLLAKACEGAHQPAEAVRVLEVALEHEPDDLYCNLSLAALLMREGDGDLQRAGLLLERAEQTMRKRPVEEEIRNWIVLRMTFWALNGQENLALAQLGRLSPERRADERVEALAKVLVTVPSRPPSPWGPASSPWRFLPPSPMPSGTSGR